MLCTPEGHAVQAFNQIATPPDRSTVILDLYASGVRNDVRWGLSASLLRVDQAVDLGGEFFHHIAGDAVGLADLLVHIHAGTPDACLGGDIQSPKTKALRPAALPLEIIHQAPVEIALDLVIMGDHVP